MLRSIAWQAAAVALLAAPVWSGGGVVALQTADPTCGILTTGRYVDCDNGTVMDAVTRLVWLAKADCFGALPWHEAMVAVSGLGDLDCGPLSSECDCGLSDGSSPGEWRLASRDEWVAMVAAADGLSCVPTIANDAGNDCWDQQCVDLGACSFFGVQQSWYWSSSSYVPDPSVAWGVSFNNGTVDGYAKDADLYVWPVRGGQ